MVRHQSRQCSVPFSALACMQLQGWYPCRRAWDFRSESTTQKNSIIQQDEQKNSAVAASELRATKSAQPPRSSDLETTVSHVIIMIINLLAAQVASPYRLPPPTPTVLDTMPSLILQAKGTKSDNGAYWLEFGKGVSHPSTFHPRRSELTDPGTACSPLGSPVRCAITVAPGGDSDFRRLNKFVGKAWHCVHSRSLHCIDSFSPSQASQTNPPPAAVENFPTNTSAQRYEAHLSGCLAAWLRAFDVTCRHGAVDGSNGTSISTFGG